MFKATMQRHNTDTSASSPNKRWLSDRGGETVRCSSLHDGRDPAELMEPRYLSARDDASNIAVDGLPPVTTSIQSHNRANTSIDPRCGSRLLRLLYGPPSSSDRSSPTRSPSPSNGGIDDRSPDGNANFDRPYDASSSYSSSSFERQCKYMKKTHAFEPQLLAAELNFDVPCRLPELVNREMFDQSPLPAALKQLAYSPPLPSLSRDQNSTWSDSGYEPDDEFESGSESEN